jgi:hypothetical protein
MYYWTKLMADRNLYSQISQWSEVAALEVNYM